jgi:hypothetical protein
MRDLLLLRLLVIVKTIREKAITIQEEKVRLPEDAVAKEKITKTEGLVTAADEESSEENTK